MKLSLLLAHRQALLGQAQLANLAFAYAKLNALAIRVARAQLRGAVTLRRSASDGEPIPVPLAALEGHQSVIEEHFTDEELVDCADAIAFLTGRAELELTFRIEELADRFVAPLRQQLEQAGVTFEHEAPAINEPHRGHSAD